MCHSVPEQSHKTAAVAAVGKDSGTHCHAIHLEVVDRTDHAACITGQTLHRHILRHIAVLCLKTLGRFAGGCAQQAARTAALREDSRVAHHAVLRG